MELIANPAVLFLDEPTTGLDSYNAYAVVRQLSSLAKQGRTVIATIHQPNSDIFASLDDICLMSNSEIIYFGPADVVPQYFYLLSFTIRSIWDP